VRDKQKRNSQILELHNRGMSRSALAAKHRLTSGRIAQIVAATAAVDARRAELAAQYGTHPIFARLSDDTPLDVLILASSRTHGWPVRILAMCNGRNPIKTLGELRRMSDRELMARRGVGAGLFAEMRALCPYHIPKIGKAAPAKPARKSTVSPGSPLARTA
jgi:hypothetical protein